MTNVTSNQLLDPMVADAVVRLNFVSVIYGALRSRKAAL